MSPQKNAKKPRILFVCSQNRWRSPTAEKIYQRDNRISVRSRGTSSNARCTVRKSDIDWADVILVMETKHQRRLRADYPQALTFKEMHVLDVPDDYRYMDPELIDLLETAVDPLLNDLQS